MTKSSLNPQITPDDQCQDRFHGQKPPKNPGRTDLTPATGIQGPPEERLISEVRPESTFDPLGYCPPEKRPHHEPAAREASKGRFIKAVKLKCMDCSGWEYREARACHIHQCALWLLNRRIFARTGRSAS